MIEGVVTAAHEAVIALSLGNYMPVYTTGTEAPDGGGRPRSRVGEVDLTAATGSGQRHCCNLVDVVLGRAPGPAQRPPRDRTYTITAWAVNKAIAAINDYHDTNGADLTNPYGIEFTVLK